MSGSVRTFFMHVEEGSPLLKLHPSVKLISLLVINLVAWILEAPIPLLLMLLLILAAYVFGRVSLRRLGRFVAFAIVVAQAIVVSYLLGSSIPGRVVLLRLPWGTYVSDMTLLYIAAMMLRFANMLLGSTLVLSVTRDTDIIYGLVSLKVPFLAAFAFNLALRFSSLFLEDSRMVRDAMMLRGATLDKGNPITRARLYSKMGIPLTVIALRRMAELTYVLEIKGLGARRRRTYLHEFEWRAGDAAALAILLAALAAALSARAATRLVAFPGWPLA